MTRESDEARGEAAIALPEQTHICTVCHREYRDEASHVANFVHLDAMAIATIREWQAVPADDDLSLRLARQIARLEYFAEDYDRWRASMDLPDNFTTAVMHDRLTAIWIRAIGMPDYTQRMSLARRMISIEFGGTGFV